MNYSMFDVITKTWNPVIGCLHNCKYCWARRLAETRLTHMEKYKDGFKPNLAEYELKKKFRKQYVFACDMGDLFGDWVPRDWILKVIDAVKNSPSSYFLFLTKNPRRYFDILDALPKNLILGVTIETNRNYRVSNAPPQSERYRCMVELPYARKLVSVEPIMDFDMDIFVEWIRKIGPIMVHVGYTKFNEHLPEPSLVKTRKLMEELKSFTRVKELRLREKY